MSTRNLVKLLIGANILSGIPGTLAVSRLLGLIDERLPSSLVILGVALVQTVVAAFAATSLRGSHFPAHSSGDVGGDSPKEQRPHRRPWGYALSSLGLLGAYGTLTMAIDCSPLHQRDALRYIHVLLLTIAFGVCIAALGRPGSITRQ